MRGKSLRLKAARRFNRDVAMFQSRTVSRPDARRPFLVVSNSLKTREVRPGDLVLPLHFSSLPWFGSQLSRIPESSGGAESGRNEIAKFRVNAGRPFAS